jgi:hypothetical protein
MMGIGVHKHHLVLKPDLEAGTMCKKHPIACLVINQTRAEKITGH